VGPEVLSSQALEQVDGGGLHRAANEQNVLEQHEMRQAGSTLQKSLSAWVKASRSNRFSQDKVCLCFVIAETSERNTSGMRQIHAPS
jgi:hypothetical protein